MDTLLIICAGILVVAGLVGSIFPKLPGTPLSYLGLILIHLSTLTEYSIHFFVHWGLIVITVQGLDYLLPRWGTRKFGGSKRGVWGGIIGLLVCFYFGKWGIVAGAVLGSFIGELTGGRKTYNAIHQSIGAFSIFIIGTISQLIVSGWLFHHYFAALSLWF